MVKKSIEKRHTGIAVACLMLGISAFLFSFVPFANIIAFIMVIIAIIFAIVAFVNKKSKKSLAVTGLILSIFAIAIGIVSNIVAVTMIKNYVQSSDYVLKYEAQVSVGSFEVERRTYGKSTALPVTVKNLTNETKTFSATIAAYDEDGAEIQQSSIYIKDIAPGQAASQNAFISVDNEKLPAVENATFKVISASSVTVNE